MPSITVSALINQAVYWPPAPNTGGYPDAGAFADPVEVACRWIDAPFNRQEANRSYLYIDRDVQSGGYLFKGSLADLLPSVANMSEYPVESPHDLGEWAGHWQFDGTLSSQDEGPEFAMTTGYVYYEDGARGQSITNNGTFDLGKGSMTTVDDVDLADSEAWTLSFWLRLHSPSPSPAVSPSVSAFASPSGSMVASPSPSPSAAFLTMNAGGLAIQIDGGGVSINGSAYDVDLYQYDWVNLQVINGDTVTLKVAGVEIANDNAPAPVPVTDTPITVDWHNDSEVFWLDEMLMFPFSATDSQSQSLAGRSPMDYDNAKSIIRTQFASSINGKLRVRKVMLEGRIQ